MSRPEQFSGANVHPDTGKPLLTSVSASVPQLPEPFCHNGVGIMLRRIGIKTRGWLSVAQGFGIRLGVFSRPADPKGVREIIEKMKPRRIDKDLILVGDGGDGTYVLPNDLEGIGFCFSPGVGPVAKFEERLFSEYDIKSFLIDASVEAVPSKKLGEFVFDRLFLGAFSRPDFISLQDWVHKYQSNDHEDYILQMDIEGAEYAAILSAPQVILRRFRIIAIELHSLDMLVLPQFRSIFVEFLEKLMEDFVVCYASGNNCCGSIEIDGRTVPRALELTLVRRDRVQILDGLPDSSLQKVDNIGSNNFISLTNWF